MNLFVFIGSLVLLASSAHAMPKKATANKSESQIEIGGLATDEMAMGAKLVVDPSKESALDTAATSAPTSAPLAPMAATADAGGAAATGAAAAGDMVPAKQDIAKVPENQIPVLTGVKETKKASSNGFTRMMITLGVLLVALGAATFGLKRFASRRGKKNQNTKIKVLTTHALGAKKSIAIIQVAGESILVGITDHNISMLKTLALIDDEFPEDIPKHFDAALSGHDFEEDQDRYGEMPAVKGRQRQNQIAARNSDHDDFVMQGLGEIRDKVSTRLKNMKNF